MKELKALLDKYWNGNSEISEEKLLKEEFSEDENSAEADFFQYLEEKSGESIDDPGFDRKVMGLIKRSENKGKNILINWKLAAVIILLVGAAMVFQFVLPEKNVSDQQMLADTYDDPERAFEEAKKALLFISTKLNEGSSYTVELGKFSESQEKLKQD